MKACKYCGLPTDTYSGYCRICEDKFRECDYGYRLDGDEDYGSDGEEGEDE